MKQWLVIAEYIPAGEAYGVDVKAATAPVAAKRALAYLWKKHSKELRGTKEIECTIRLKGEVSVA